MQKEYKSASKVLKKQKTVKIFRFSLLLLEVQAGFEPADNGVADRVLLKLKLSIDLYSIY